MTDRLESLQILRAVAAMMVALFHLQQHVLPHHLGQALWPGLSMGYAGVEIFFVLSGYIMMHVHGREIGRRDATGRFLLRRAARILPLYWIVLGMVVLGRFAMTGAIPDAERLFAAAFLLPNQMPILRVAWTLGYEMLFYGAFALLIWRPASIAWLATGLAFGMLALVSLNARPAAVLLTVAQEAPYALLFLLGIAAACLQQRLTAPAALAFAAFGAFGVLAVGLSEALTGLAPEKPLRTLLYGVCAAALIAGLAAWEGAGRRRMPPFLIRLGDASYALYLLHLPVMSFAAKLVSSLRLDLPPWLNAAGLVLLATAAALCAHRVLERPMLRRLSHAIGRVTPKPDAMPVDLGHGRRRAAEANPGARANRQPRENLQPRASLDARVTREARADLRAGRVPPPRLHT
ncbi:MAG: acyltransferase [Pseudomonadota bacterium]